MLQGLAEVYNSCGFSFCLDICNTHDYTGHYLTKAASDPGAGDILMGFLGSVILSFSFSMFKQRKVINIRNPVWWKYNIKFEALV